MSCGPVGIYGWFVEEICDCVYAPCVADQSCPGMRFHTTTENSTITTSTILETTQDGRVLDEDGE
jgi:hypothetical protein